jgi:hypothetical protein
MNIKIMTLGVGCVMYRLNGNYILRIPPVISEYLSPRMPRKLVFLRYLLEDLSGRNHFEDKGVDEKIIL